jgi:hypothetical protein
MTLKRRATDDGSRSNATARQNAHCDGGRSARIDRFSSRLLPGWRSERVKYRMADELPKPEPKEIDEKLALQFKHLSEDAVLKGKPYGDEQCSNCLFYLNPDEKIAYCWHPKLRILVGDVWWCQWWEPIA